MKHTIYIYPLFVNTFPRNHNSLINENNHAIDRNAIKSIYIYYLKDLITFH